MATELSNNQSSDISIHRIQRLTENPYMRQLAVMVGIAVSVALGVSVVMWSQTPNYGILYASVAEKDVADIMQALQQNGINFKVDEHSGAVMVPTKDLQAARIKLAAEGLPKSNDIGFEMLQQDTGFGTSRQIEAARFQRALEGELSRSIATLANVQSARVHLATPKQSVFIRKRKHPSASVVVKLYSGRVLDQGQVDAIVHLVASSVPELNPARVTVVDQKARLLSGRNEPTEIQLSSKQLEYTKALEEHYKRRIEDLLAPLLGPESVRAEVTAEVDFTITEKTQEVFNPDVPALRSEQVKEQQSQLSAVQGVPGALSNQPPGGGIAPERVQGEEQTEGGENATQPLSVNKFATRNYELDKVISHTRLASGVLRRLSVAVVVDDRHVVGENGEVQRLHRTEEEISEISNLVRESIGFKMQRGDSVRVINSTFHVPAPPELVPEAPLWEQPWFLDLMRQLGGALLVLALVFGVLRPTLRRLTAIPAAQNDEQAANEEQENAQSSVSSLKQNNSDTAALSRDARVQLPGPESYETNLDTAKDMVDKDSKRVAQVVRQWVAE